MFIGHYGAALAIKGGEKNAPLGWLFLATQLPDILLFSFALLGIERVNIVASFTQSTNFELVFIPYSHSLIGTVLWALVAYLLSRSFSHTSKRLKKAIPIAITVAIISHWFLDLVVHTPDLPLLGNNSPKVGLGLWNSASITFILEAGILLTGAWVYLRGSIATSAVGKYGMIALVVLMIAANAFNLYGPAQADVATFSVISLMTLLGFSAFAFWLDRKRVSPCRKNAA